MCFYYYFSFYLIIIIIVYLFINFLYYMYLCSFWIDKYECFERNSWKLTSDIQLFLQTFSISMEVFLTSNERNLKNYGCRRNAQNRSKVAIRMKTTRKNLVWYCHPWACTILKKRKTAEPSSQRYSKNCDRQE